MTSMPGWARVMDEVTRRSNRIRRFTAAERWTHRSIAVLFFILIATAAVLFIPELSVLVGNRPLMRTVHIAAGVLLPVPIILALLSAAFRADARRLNRFSDADWRWLRSRDRDRLPSGKFNAGQKLNAAFTLGAVIVMFATGMIMWQNRPFPDDIRTGATFVHDWLTLAIVIVIAGHIWMALRDVEARRGMRTGSVSADWARNHHSDWAIEILPPSQDETPSTSRTP
jgi:formate dehydrogenase subunit gamma